MLRILLISWLWPVLGWAQTDVPQKITAQWIRHPTAPLTEHAVVLFRKDVALAQKPTTFIVHVSGDNQYRLFVNGRAVGRGPARGDMAHYFYETYDLAPYLQAGRNVLAAEVVNYGPKRAFSLFSQITAFWLQGHGPAEQVADTRGGRWQTYHNTAVHGRPVNWIFNKNDIAFGLYTGNPTDSVSSATYPWNWEQPEFPATGWVAADWADGAGLRGTGHAGGINYAGGWLLQPRRSPVQTEEKEVIGRVVRINAAPGAIAGPSLQGKVLSGQGFSVGPNQHVKLLIDHGVLTVGFPELSMSHGRGSRVQVTYAECLFNADGKTKGHRDTVGQKRVIGIKDFYLPGHPEVNQNLAVRTYRPTWFRAFRYVELDIQTADEPLNVTEFANQRYIAPLTQTAQWQTDDPRLDRLVAPSWRTAHIGAQDFLMSDAYYELMQYTGDTRVHSLALLTLAGDDRLTRNALIQFDESRIPEGLTYACAPNKFHLIMPAYSLIWVDQVYDYMLWRDDKAFIRDRLPGVRAVLAWYERLLRPDGLLGPVNWWPALAWPKGFKNGEPPENEKGGSLFHALHYAYTLNHAAEVFAFTGDVAEAARCRALAVRINMAARTLGYDPQRNLFAENPERKLFSSVTNILAVLSGAAPSADAPDLLRRVLTDTSLNGQPDLFWHLYLFEALNKTGLQDRFAGELSEWQTMMDRGLTTFVEVPIEWGEEHQRSDCHPWSTSPAVFFYKTLAGITPTAPGHRAVRLSPKLGHLKALRATYPHPLGNLALDLKQQGGRLSGRVTVPPGMAVTWQHGNVTRRLKSGENVIP